jgi:DNA-binding protein YbaB
MPVSPGSAGFGEALEQVIQAAGQVQAASGQAAEPQTGEAADGLIRATTGAKGRLASLSLHPDVLMLPPERLAREITAAVNQALRAQDEAVGLAASGVDLSGLQEQLREVQETAAARMTMFMDAMTAAQENLAQRVRR